MNKDAPADAQETPEQEASKADATEDRTYSQAEIDRRVTDALKKAEDKANAKIAAERERLEQEKLAEQGEFKKLHETTKAKLEELQATLATKEQREQVSAALREAGLSEFEPILVAERSNPDDFVAAGKSLQETMKTLVDAEVARRLETGPTKGGVKTAETPAQRGMLVYPSMATK